MEREPCLQKMYFKWIKKKLIATFVIGNVNVKKPKTIFGSV